MKHDKVEQQRISLFVDPDVLSIADDIYLYNSNPRYRELFDKDEQGVASEEELIELREIYREASN